MSRRWRRARARRAAAHRTISNRCCCKHLYGVGGRVRFGVELVDLVDTGDAVLATIRDETTAVVDRVEAAYVIGADGPRSTVRAAAGIGIEDLGTIGDFVSVTFRAHLTHRLAGLPAAINTVETAGAEGVFVPTSTDDRWIYARQWHPETGERIDRLDTAALRRADQGGVGRRRPVAGHPGRAYRS